MELIADGLLISAAGVSALYCYILSRRLTALRSMDQGLGGAIAGLSARVEQTKASLADTKATTSDLSRELSSVTARAEIAAGRLELLLATLHESQDELRSEPTPSEPTETDSDTPSSEARRSTSERRLRDKGEIVTALRRIAEGGGR
ncbi:MAG: hypothetical protein AAGB10_00850 [Pseudomonadota bacterium]